MLSELIHGPEEMFSAVQWYETMPSHSVDTLCYFFCRKGFRDVRWVVVATFVTVDVPSALIYSAVNILMIPYILMK